MATILTLTSLPEGSKTGDYIKATKTTQGLIQGEVYVILDVGNNVVVHISSENFDPSILTGETIFFDGTKDKSIKTAIDLKANLLADVVEINSSFELKEEHSGKILICNNSSPISITLDTGIAITSGRAINCLVLRHNADVEFVDELPVSLKSISFNELVHVIQDGSHWHLWGTKDSTGLNPSDIDTVSLSDSDEKVPSSKLMAQLLSELPSGGGDVEEAPIDGKQYVRKDGAWVDLNSVLLTLDANEIYDLIEEPEEPEGNIVYEFMLNLTNNPTYAGMGYYGYLNNTENPEAMGTLSGYSSPSFIDSITALFWTKFADYGEEHWLSEAHVTGSSLDIFEQPIGHLNEQDEVVWHYKLRVTVDNTFVIEGDIMMEDENSWGVGAILSQGDYPTIITATEGSYPVKLEIIKK